MSDASNPRPSLPPSADIIPFPARGTPAVQAEAAALVTALAEDPRDRLQRALAMLQQAQAEQRQALAKWRTALADLSTSVSGLTRSVHQYQHGLSEITPPPTP